jgi:hypothetical protein
MTMGRNASPRGFQFADLETTLALDPLDDALVRQFAKPLHQERTRHPGHATVAIGEMPTAAEELAGTGVPPLRPEPVKRAPFVTAPSFRIA